MATKTDLTSLSEADLHSRRRTLIAEGRGDPSGLPIEKLEELSAIYDELRRRTTGGPGKPKKPKAEPKASIVDSIPDF